MLFKNTGTQVSYQFVTVTQGKITETVSLTGNTIPIQSASLAFQSGGTIAHTYFNLGDQVHKGDVIAKLNEANLSAALAQAQADVDAQEAQLQGILNGAQPEDVSVSQTSLASAQSNLDEVTKEQDVSVANAYRALLNSNIMAQPFISSSIPPPVITGMYTQTDTGDMTISIHGTPSGGYFSVSGLGGTSTGMLNSVYTNNSTTSPPVAIGDTGLYLRLPNSSATTTTVDSTTGLTLNTSGVGGIIQNGSQTNDVTNDYGDTSWIISIPNVSGPSYTQNYNTYQQALQTQKQAIATAQAQVDQARAGLNFKQAGPITESVAAQQARVNQAKAVVLNAEANLQNIEIIAPIDGTLTQQDAKVGEQASPGIPLISIISNSGFEVDAGVSEKDIGKLQVGTPVAMTFDVFPNEIFTGSMFYIAPTETNNQGVVTYLVKISFDKPDIRFKSGLTVNLTINTKQNNNALILPGNAILQNDAGAFVEVLDENGKDITRVPVTLGIQDQDDNDEILSGVTAGEQVLNIGLKKK